MHHELAAYLIRLILFIELQVSYHVSNSRQVGFSPSEAATVSSAAEKCLLTCVGQRAVRRLTN